MSFIPPETIEKARQIDLLTYLEACEPDELVHISGDHYCTREHDSLKISKAARNSAPHPSRQEAQSESEVSDERF